MFFPGETITHRFIIPFAKGEIDHVVISYKQNDHILLEKTITSNSEDMSVDSAFTTKIEYTLNQTESLTFDDDLPFTMQINVYSFGGSRHASHEINSSNGMQYFREVMNNAS